MEKIKDPLGVVAKWREEESAHHLTGWDDAKFGVGGMLLIAVLIGGPLVFIWSVFF